MVDEILFETEERMDGAIEALNKQFIKIRTGRANPKMLDDVLVEYYGAPTPINQVGGVSVPEATQLLIKPYDKTILGDIEKAIIAANLGVTPTNDGSTIRIVLPALTEERRRELTKQVKKLSEEGKVAIRNVRRDANDSIKKLEKNSDITEDESKGYQEDIQKLTDDYVKKIDLLAKEKEADIMSI